MSPPHLGIEVDVQSVVSSMTSSSADSVPRSSSGIKGRIYLGQSESSSKDSTIVPSGKNGTLHLKGTELSLGLPGSQSPERDVDRNLMSSEEFDEKPLFPLVPSKDGIFCSSQKAVVSGNKRGYTEAIDGFPARNASRLSDRNWMFPAGGSESEASQSVVRGNFAPKTVTGVLPNKSSGAQGNETASVEGQCAADGSNHPKMNASNNSSAPAAKAQVVGWPPIRSFRKSTLATASKKDCEVDGKQSYGALFVKVSMDGAPYLRKVDLRTYTTYAGLSSSLGKMFFCFILGTETSPKEMRSQSTMSDLQHGFEYVIAYEDKDGDWMLVGDVPWEMFIESCKRLKIMKGSDAIGLTPPRVMEKSSK